MLLYPQLPMAKIVGSDIAHAVPLTLIAGLGHWMMGSVDWHIIASLLVGSLPGIFVGSYFAIRMPGARLAGGAGDDFVRGGEPHRLRSRHRGLVDLHRLHAACGPLAPGVVAVGLNPRRVQSSTQRSARFPGPGELDGCRNPVKAAPAAIGVSMGLSVLPLMFWILTLATLSDLAGSDAAGNGYAQAYAAIEIVILWGLLALIALIAGVKGAMAWPSAIAAALLIPASAVVAFEVLELLSRPSLPPFLWPLVIPAVVPPLVLAFCFWALIPPLHTVIGPRLAGGFVWGAVLLLCLAIVPLQQMRNEADNRVAAALEKYNADLAKLPPDAPLWDWAPFLDTANSTKQEELLAHIRTLDRRQSDAELMLERGDFPLGFLGRLDLTPTPAICDKARALVAPAGRAAGAADAEFQAL